MEKKALYETTERKDVKEIIYRIAKEYNEMIAFVIKHKEKRLKVNSWGGKLSKFSTPTIDFQPK